MTDVKTLFPEQDDDSTTPEVKASSVGAVFITAISVSCEWCYDEVIEMDIDDIEQQDDGAFVVKPESAFPGCPACGEVSDLTGFKIGVTKCEP